MKERISPVVNKRRWGDKWTPQLKNAHEVPTSLQTGESPSSRLCPHINHALNPDLQRSTLPPKPIYLNIIPGASPHPQFQQTT